MSHNELPSGGSSEDPMVLDSDVSFESNTGDENPEDETLQYLEAQQDTQFEAEDDGENITASKSTNSSLSAQPSAAVASFVPTTVSSRPAPTGVNNSGDQQHDPIGSNQGAHSSAPMPTLVIGPGGGTAVAVGSHSGVTVAVTSRASHGRKKAFGPVVGGQQARNENEVLSLDPSKPDSVIIRFRIQIPGEDGMFFEQVDEIPKRDANAVSPPVSKSYFLRNPALAKIPSRKRANKENNHNPPLWVRQPGTHKWRRSGAPGQADDIWELVVVFRRLNTVTHSYEEAYLSKSKLNKVNPNDKEFMYAYNKWIDQFRRRRDPTYEKTTRKDHWTIPERRALMEGINAFVAKKGLKNFGAGASLGMATADMQVVTDRVNAAGGMDRGVEATRAQIISAHIKKNKAIFELRNRANLLRHRLTSGESISRAERYPQEAIPRWQFPIEEKASRPKKPKNTKKTADEQSNNDNRKQSPTPPVSRSLAPSSSALKRLKMGGAGVPPAYPNRVRTSLVYGEMPGWEDVDDDEEDMEDFCEPVEVETQPVAEQEDDEMAWESTSSDCSYADFDEEQERDERDERENEELARQEAIDLQHAITESMQDHGAVGGNASGARRQYRAAGVGEDHPGPITIGIGPSGDSGDSSDSDSDVPARAPVPASRSLRPGLMAGRPSTPEQGKRKRAPKGDDEGESSTGDDEAEMSSPQGRKIKKPRMLARK